MLIRLVVIVVSVIIFAGPGAFGKSSVGGRKKGNQHDCYEYRKNEKLTYFLRKRRYQSNSASREALSCRNCMEWKKAFLKSEGKLPIQLELEDIMTALELMDDTSDEGKKELDGFLKEKKAQSKPVVFKQPEATVIGRRKRNTENNGHQCIKYRENEKITYSLRKRRYQGNTTTREALSCKECMLWKEAFLKSGGKLPVLLGLDAIIDALEEMEKSDEGSQKTDTQTGF